MCGKLVLVGVIMMGLTIMPIGNSADASQPRPAVLNAEQAIKMADGRADRIILKASGYNVRLSSYLGGCPRRARYDGRGHWLVNVWSVENARAGPWLCLIGFSEQPVFIIEDRPDGRVRGPYTTRSRAWDKVSKWKFGPGSGGWVEKTPTFNACRWGDQR